MNALLLHLSDLHLTNEKMENKIEDIRKSLNIFNDVKEIVLLFTGDLSQNGSNYKLVSSFIKALSSGITKDFNLLNEPKVLIVPGNHDLKFEDDFLRGEASILVEHAIKTAYYGNDTCKELTEELNKLSKFYEFSNKYDCFQDDLLIDVKTIKILNIDFRFNLINTSPFSLFNDTDNDKGLHFLQSIHISKLSQSISMPTITLMHHPTEWFHENVQSYLEQEIFDNTNILFLGHQHLGYTVSQNKSAQMTDIIKGGSLNRQNDNDESDYYAIEIDQDMNYNIYNFQWNRSLKFYKHSIKNNGNLINNITVCVKLNLQKEFYENFYIDPFLYEFVPSIKELFTFPDIEILDYTSKNPKINSMEDLLTLISENDIINIKGANSSGKTTLSKMIFEELVNGFVPIHYNAEDEVRAQNLNGKIKSLIQEQFGFDNGELQFFEQLPKRYKILIIDNYDSVRKNKKWIPYLTTIFSKIIILSSTDSNLDVKQLFDEQTSSNYKTSTISIKPFLKRKREKLILKTCNYIMEIKNYKLNPKKVSIYIENQLNLFSLSPLFIILYIREYGLPSVSGKSATKVFSVIFEKNITGKLEESNEGVFDVDIAFDLLELISFESYQSKTYPIPISLISKIIDDYNVKYGNGVDTTDFLNTILNAKILRKTSVQNQYAFTSKRYLSYFIAKELKRRFDNGEQSIVVPLYDNLLVKINSEILLFFTFLFNRNTIILEAILDKALIYMGSWDELNLNKYNVEYFKKLNLTMNVIEPTKHHIESVIDKQEEKEEEIHKQEFEIVRTDVYDMEIDMTIANPLILDIANGVKYLHLISSIFPDFFKFLEVPLKNKFVNSILKLPNQLLYRIFKDFDDDFDDEMDKILIEMKKKDPLSKDKDNYKLAIKMLHKISEMIIVMVYKISSSGIVNSDSITWFADGVDQKKYTNLLMSTVIDVQIANPEKFGASLVKLMNTKNNKIVSNMAKSIANEFFVKNDDCKKLGETKKLYDKTFNIVTQNPKLKIK